jgi:transcriptional antiterminator
MRPKRSKVVDQRWKEYAKMHGFKTEKAMFKNLYNLPMTTYEIADKLGYAQVTIHKRMTRCGIKMRPKGWQRS